MPPFGKMVYALATASAEAPQDPNKEEGSSGMLLTLKPDDRATATIFSIPAFAATRIAEVLRDSTSDFLTGISR